MSPTGLPACPKKITMSALAEGVIGLERIQDTASRCTAAVNIKFQSNVIYTLCGEGC